MSDKIVYRYRSVNEYLKYGLSEGFFAPTRSKLNDPMDGLYYPKVDGRKTKYRTIINYLKENYHDLIGERIINVTSNEDVYQLLLEREDIFEKVRSYQEFNLEKFIQYVSQKFGVVCFSENKENILMWAHYADSFKGVCIGYSDVETTESDLRFNIKYTEALDEFDNQWTLDETIKNVFNKKKTAWSYEEETRIVCREGDKEIPNHYKVTEIVIGVNFFEELKTIKEQKNFDILVEFIKTNNLKIFLQKIGRNKSLFYDLINKTEFVRMFKKSRGIV
jgi:hypothetical protein